jgi:glycosyltransferase involved in cell wall biosynthesis
MKLLFSHYAVIDKEGFGRTFMLAREMALRGHAVDLLTTLPSGKFIFPYRKEERDGVQLYAFPDIVPDALRRTGFGALSVLLRCLFIMTRSYDVVFGDNGHRPSSGWCCRVHRLFRKSKYVTEWWDFFGRGGQYDELSWTKKITKGAYDRLTEVADKRAADGVIVLSQKMKERALNNKVSAAKLTVIQGGCDVRTIHYRTPGSTKEKFGLSPDTFCFGFAGMNEGELLDVLPFISAVNALKEELPLQWMTTGRKLSDAVKQQYQVGDALKEFGWVDYDDYSEVLACADVFILLQQENMCNETRWPNKLGDYLAAGRIVLTNPVGELRHLCAAYPEQLISCASEQKALMQTMRELAARPQQVAAAGRRSREIAMTELSWAAKAKELEHFITVTI